MRKSDNCARTFETHFTKDIKLDSGTKLWDYVHRASHLTSVTAVVNSPVVLYTHPFVQGTAWKEGK